MSIVLPRELWEAARIEQDARVEQDPWDDLLAGAEFTVVSYQTQDGKGTEERISTHRIF
jgi:hypothetical protein